MGSFDRILAGVFGALFLVLIINFSNQVNHKKKIDIVVSGLESGDYHMIDSDLIPLAEANNARAQYNLGLAFLRGDGVQQNDKLAYYWTKRAAENGDKRATLNLANMYLEGRGTKQDESQAFKWFSKAAINGDSNAQLAMGRMYRDGAGVKQDYKMAFYYISAAAASGNNIDAKTELAEMYINGWGTRKDVFLASRILSELNTAGYKKE